MKVSELSGAQLDYWVAIAEEKGAYVHGGYCFLRPADNNSGTAYQPSSDWARGGPILERMLLSGWGIWRYADADYFRCSNYDTEALSFGHEYNEGEPFFEEGSTMLIAAMRCYVASKFGDEVADWEGVA